MDIAADGEEGLLKADDEYDLIFTYQVMPKMSGLELITALRARGDKRPIVCVTASAFPEQEKLIAQAGASLILEKPLSRQLLIDCVEELQRGGYFADK